MDGYCDLEVDVNGEQTFFIHQNIILSYSGKLRNLFCKSKSLTKNLKVILHDFPGGSESFELVLRFCYNNGKIIINPYTAPRLFCAAHYMEMNGAVSGSVNLLERSEKSLEDIKFWSWPELLSGLKHCQSFFQISSLSGILQKCLDSVVARLVFTSESGPSCPSSSSPESSVVRLSTDSKSTESLRSGFVRSTWWFEDLTTVLTPKLVKLLVKLMLLHKFDHGLASRFLFYYHKSRLIMATSEEKREITETIIDSLSWLDKSSISCKNLFGILRVALNLNVKKVFKSSLELMIGSQLGQATIDDVLVPSPHGSIYLYDVNLVLQLVKYFLMGPKVPVSELKKVAQLIDSYVAEVAPDHHLKPSKFLALVKALPESTRDSYDEIYHAIDTYLRVHTNLTEEEKISIFNSLNYNKLSSESCNHLTHNDEFPPRYATLALKAQQLKLENLLCGMDLEKHLILPAHKPIEAEPIIKRLEQARLYAEQVVPNGRKHDIVKENEKMKAHLEGMQWRVVELEKVCRKMQTQMTKILKSRLSRQTSTKSLPRLCS